MRKVFLATSVLLLASSVGTAAPACGPGSLAKYIALGAGGCTVGPITFANFAYSAKSSGGAPQIQASQIQVTPSFQVPATGGFVFSAKWSVVNNQAQESIIKYTVSGKLAGAGNLMLQLGKYQINLFGDISVQETTSGGNLQVYVDCGETCKVQTSAQAPFIPPATVLQVTDDVKLSSGIASLSSFTAEFDYCPACV